jgi:hypothetical protein
VKAREEPQGAAARRLRRELETARVMIQIHCRGRHGTTRELCDECEDLWQYVTKRIEHCPFLLDKPTCLNCTVHCYKPDMRERIRDVMRFAGPRMPWRHPVLSLFHFIDGKKPAPTRGSDGT